MSPLSEVAGGKNKSLNLHPLYMIVVELKASIDSSRIVASSRWIREAMWKLKPTDARLKRTSSYPTTPVVGGIRKTGSS
jgi:hypothetical protein